MGLGEGKDGKGLGVGVEECAGGGRTAPSGGYASRIQASGVVLGVVVWSVGMSGNDAADFGVGEGFLEGGRVVAVKECK